LFSKFGVEFWFALIRTLIDLKIIRLGVYFRAFYQQNVLVKLNRIEDEINGIVKIELLIVKTVDFARPIDETSTLSGKYFLFCSPHERVELNFCKGYA